MKPTQPLESESERGNCYRGLWRRIREEEPIGTLRDCLSRVYWMQSEALFTDIRVPPALPFDATGPKRNRGWESFSTAELVHIARFVRGFAGDGSVAGAGNSNGVTGDGSAEDAGNSNEGAGAGAGANVEADEGEGDRKGGAAATAVASDEIDERPVFTWDRVIDHRPFQGPDVGRMDLSPCGGHLIEDGADGSYREWWDRVDKGEMVASLRLVSERRECCVAKTCASEGHERKGYMIFTGRTHMSIAIDRRRPLPANCATIEDFLREHGGWDGSDIAQANNSEDNVDVDVNENTAAAAAAVAAAADAAGGQNDDGKTCGDDPSATALADPEDRALRAAAATVLSYHAHLASCVIRRGAMDGVRVVATTTPHLDHQRRVLGPRLAASGRYTVDTVTRRVEETMGLGVDGLATELGEASTPAGRGRVRMDPFGDGTLLPHEPAVVSRVWEIVDWDYDPFTVS